MNIGVNYATGTILALYVSIAANETISQEASCCERRKAGTPNAKDRFLAAVSHEIRTPLNGILGIAQIMNYDAQDPPARERARVLLASGIALEAIVDDILDHTKLRDGEFSIRPAATRVNGIVDHVANLFDRMAAESHMRSCVTPARSVPGRS